jgi:predicted nucleic-acid-binding protein
VKIAVDTNIMLRALIEDDPRQAADAKQVLEQATLIAIPVPVFCEIAWTMRRLYKRDAVDIADAIEAILAVATVVTDRSAVEAGLRVLRRGGDFADGAIAWQGEALGGEVLMTFDRQAIGILTAEGMAAQVPPTAESRR